MTLTFQRKIRDPKELSKEEGGQRAYPSIKKAAVCLWNINKKRFEYNRQMRK